jgi:hypothetical protein
MSAGQMQALQDARAALGRAILAAARQDLQAIRTKAEQIRWSLMNVRGYRNTGDGPGRHGG